jgi:hypothetical protein
VFDPVELPPEAAEKLRQLRAANEDSNAVLRELNGRKNTAIEVRTGAEVRLKQLQQQLATLPGMGDRTEHPSVSQANAAVEAAAREIAQLDTRLAALRAQQWRGLSGLEQWLIGLPAGPIEMHTEQVELPKLKPGGIAAAIETARANIARITADIHETRSAPLPSIVVKQRARDELAALAEQGRVDVLPAIEAGRPLAWPTIETNAELRGQAVIAEGGIAPLAGFAVVNGSHVPALMAWLFHDALIEKLEQEIDELADDENALTAEERAQREAMLSAEGLRAERIEEALIMAAEAGGQQIMRRPHPDPRAVLALAETLPARRR